MCLCLRKRMVCLCTFRADSYGVCSAPHVQLHALTSVCMKIFKNICMKISRKVSVCVLKISSIGSHAIVWMHEIGQTQKSECGCTGGRGIENNHMDATHLLKNLWTTSVTEECRCL